MRGPQWMLRNVHTVPAHTEYESLALITARYHAPSLHLVMTAQRHPPCSHERPGQSRATSLPVTHGTGRLSIPS